MPHHKEAHQHFANGQVHRVHFLTEDGIIIKSINGKDALILKEPI